MLTPIRGIYGICLLLFCALTTKAADLPNVILLVVDSLRQDHVGCYGYNRATTPAMDRLAREGVMFKNAVSGSSWTTPAVMSLFTGLLPSDHGVTRNQNVSLREHWTTLAAEFKKAGYRTIGLTSNPSINRQLGFDRGFDLYDDYSVWGDADLEPAEGQWAGQEGVQNTPTSLEVSAFGKKWITKQTITNQPIFMFLFYLDPHYDYRPASPYDEMFTPHPYTGEQDGRNILGLKEKNLSLQDKEQIVGLYDGEIRYVDDQIESLLKDLEEKEALKNAIVVVTADHGEEFWDHGGVAHGHTLYDELIKVPLIIRYSNRISGGHVVSNQVTHLDIMPTLLDLIGVAVPAQCRGRSVVPLVMGNKDVADGRVFAETEVYDDLRCIRTSGFKIIENVSRKTIVGYDLIEDSKELHSLGDTSASGEYAALLSEMIKWGGKIKEQRKQTANTATNQIDPGIIKQLKTLGYVR